MKPLHNNKEYFTKRECLLDWKCQGGKKRFSGENVFSKELDFC